MLANRLDVSGSVSICILIFSQCQTKSVFICSLKFELITLMALQSGEYLPKAIEPSLQVLDDLLGELIRFR